MNNKTIDIIKLFVQISVSLVIVIVAICYLDASSPLERWATGMLGTVVGYWLK